MVEKEPRKQISYLITATNPSPSLQNVMNRNSEEGLPIMKERDSIRVRKHVLSCLKIYLSFSK